jgi:predicted nuclease with TOPRIM domain
MSSFLSVLLTAIFIFMGSLSRANEEGGEHGGGEAPAAEEHEGGGHEAKTSLAPWVEVENKIQELHSKILSKQSTIQHLLEEKNHFENNSPQLKTAVKEIIKEHKELRSLVEDYDKQVNILKYRFPERNARINRTYDRFEIKSIEDMEKTLGIDGKLNRNMKRMRSQYKSTETPIVAEETTAAEPVRPKAKVQSIEEAGAPILEK